MKMLLKGEVGGYALNSHGNYIVDLKIHGKIMELFLNFCGNPENLMCLPIYFGYSKEPSQ